MANDPNADMYGDAPTAPAQSASQDQTPEDEQSDKETTLIPKSMCPGMKPGDSVTLQIVRSHEDEYEVAYEPEGKEEATESGSEPTAPQEGGMSSMLE